MPVFSSNIIQNSPKAGFPMWGWFVLVFALFFFVNIQFQLSDWTIGVFAILIAALLIVLIGLNNGPPAIKNQHLASKIVLSTETLKIGDVIFQLKELSSLKIQVNHYAGQMDERDRRIIGFNRGLRYYHDGSDNYLNFYYNGKPYKYAFFLKDEYGKEQLIEVLKSWYIQNLNFIEETAYGNTFLFQKMDYKSRKSNIEALKNEK